MSARLERSPTKAPHAADIAAAGRWLRRRAVVMGTIIAVMVTLALAAATVGIVAAVWHARHPDAVNGDAVLAFADVAPWFTAVFAVVAAVAGAYGWAGRTARRVLRRDGLAPVTLRVLERARFLRTDLLTYVDVCDDEPLYTVAGPAIGAAGWDQLATRPGRYRFVWNGRRGYLLRRAQTVRSVRPL